MPTTGMPCRRSASTWALPTKPTPMTAAGSHAEQVQRLGQAACVIAGSVQLETEHPAPAMHLFHGQRLVGMAFEEGMMHAPHLGMTGEELRNAQRILVLALHAYGQGPNA